MRGSKVYNVISLIFSNPFQSDEALKNKTDPLLKPTILTREQLKDYAKQLGYTHEIGSTSNRFYDPILSRLRLDEDILERVYANFSKALPTEKGLLPSSTEWLLDNYYIINEQIQTIKSDLTRGFYQDLVKLKSGNLKDYPRIYSLAFELLGHTDNRVDADILVDFILSYESVSPLTSAELWALPIMLRLIWIRNLTGLMEKAEESFLKRQTANNWVIQFINLQKKKSEQLTEISSLFGNKSSFDSIFLIWLLRSLRDKDHVAPLIHWLEEYIEQEDINIEEVVKAENQKQAANRVTTGNVVSSMRLISSLEWSKFFETMSMVERILRQDPAGIYVQMDFKSRDRFRHAVENLSHYSTYNEQEIARRAIKIARQCEGLKRHIGYYIIGPGEKEFKKIINYNPTRKRFLLDYIALYPTRFYLLGLVTLTFIGTSAISAFLYFHAVSILWSLVAIIPVTVPSVVLLNKLITTFYPPITPPKLELKNGIPEELRSVVVVPCMIGSELDIEKLTNMLERRYLTNKEANLLFALLVDFHDSDREVNSSEKALIETLKKSVVELNTRYFSEHGNVFYVLYRPRKYNSHEKIWMGWERKRGKLEEFNRFILGDNGTNFKILVGENTIIRTVKYVITLDSDTQTPLNTAKKLIGTMAHPLNQPIIDQKTNRVISGYGIIQPRLDIHAPSAAKSRFTRIFATDAGLDPYHSVVSNIYQDFFHNAVYIGKAIYDVRVFHQCLNQRFPENRLLSHDLLEGNFVRVGLASDIELLEDFPASYSSFSRRQRRWIQGDWQIIPWIFDATLGVQEKWKIIDNLRRSLVIPLGFLMLLCGWWLLPKFAFAWSIATITLIFFPLVDLFITSVTTRLPDEDWQSFFPALLDEIKILSARLFISLSFMSYETLRNSLAIFHALYRTTFHKKGTLEWTSHAMAERKIIDVKGMYIAIIPGLLVGILWILFGIKYSTLPLIFSCIWILSPFLSSVISKPEIQKLQKLSPEEDEKLLLIARRIWRYFDEFANKDNNFLPPDNIQISPGPLIAQRTSPTNIGLSLLAAASAFDFGFIYKDELYKYITNTFKALEKMEKFQGHFLNWYRTDTLLALQPAYVSTVDSGNLAAALITIKQLCEECAETKENQQIIKQGLEIAWQAWIEDWQYLSVQETNQLPMTHPVQNDEKDLKKLLPKLK